MPAGKHDDQVKQDDTRLIDKMNDSEIPEVQEERTRIGTVVDTRVASAGASAHSQSGSTENDSIRIGTKVDTRGEVGGGSDKPASPEIMRDGN